MTITAKAGNQGSAPTEATDPCPSWCVTDHRDTDHPDDRKHWGDDSRTVELSREGTIWEGRFDTSQLRLYLQLGVREQRSATLVVINKDDGPGLRLTLDEAAQLADVLQQLVKVGWAAASEADEPEGGKKAEIARLIAENRGLAGAPS